MARIAESLHVSVKRHAKAMLYAVLFPVIVLVVQSQELPMRFTATGALGTAVAVVTQDFNLEFPSKGQMTHPCDGRPAGATDWPESGTESGMLGEKCGGVMEYLSAFFASFGRGQRTTTIDGPAAFRFTASQRVDCSNHLLAALTTTAPAVMLPVDMASVFNDGQATENLAGNVVESSRVPGLSPVTFSTIAGAITPPARQRAKDGELPATRSAGNRDFTSGQRGVILIASPALADLGAVFRSGLVGHTGFKFGVANDANSHGVNLL